MKNKEEVFKAIGKKLEELRLNQNQTQEEIAQKIGISRKTLSQIENGSNFSVKILYDLLQEYHKLDSFLDIISLPCGLDIREFNRAVRKLKKQYA